ncbi:hypothetical protein Ahy_A08g038580 [Arachis hypogaea]|uniref:Aminotransferase-like plant mobile domain-containing protein n=1 Tax=Arachis hypogaea TaxID=3818 RepID=A0A445BTU6_ARAHY|nr:hypothetical protein Ahy_A08g038580 [Arachis hypogaea]
MPRVLEKIEQQLLGYEDTLYRLDQAEHITGRLDRVAPQILRTSQNLMTRPPEAISPYLRRFGIDGDPVSGCMGSWEQHHQARTIEDFCQQLLELEQDATEECLLRYTRGYIMQLIGGILFPNASDSRVHIRWLPLLEDLDACGRLSWGSAVLAWMYHQMCRATDHGCRWVQYRPDNTRGKGRLRHYRRILNGIRMLYVDWTPYADPYLEGLVLHAFAESDHMVVVVCPLLCFAIIEWHQVDRVVRQFGGLLHIPARPLDIDSMHGMDGRFGRGEWFPHLLRGWHELWDQLVDHCLHIHHHIDMRPSLPYMTWYLQWAHGVFWSG